MNVWTRSLQCRDTFFLLLLVDHSVERDRGSVGTHNLCLPSLRFGYKLNYILTFTNFLHSHWCMTHMVIISIIGFKMGNSGETIIQKQYCHKKEKRNKPIVSSPKCKLLFKSHPWYSGNLPCIFRPGSGRHNTVGIHRYWRPSVLVLARFDRQKLCTFAAAAATTTTARQWFRNLKVGSSLCGWKLSASFPVFYRTLAWSWSALSACQWQQRVWVMPLSLDVY